MNRVNYRKEARGRECMVRVPGVCCYNQETTVLAHLSGGGMGMKRDDLHAAWACATCHDAIDGRAKTEYSSIELKLMHYEGVIRTQQVLIEEGKL